MKSKKLFGLLAVTVAIAGVGFAASRSASADGQCRPIHGRLVSDLSGDACASPVGLCTTGATAGAGVLNGSTHYELEGLSYASGMPGVVAPSTLSYTAYLTVTTSQGTATFQDVGIFDTAAGRFTSVGALVSGTGRFAGATGNIFTRGYGTNHFDTQLDGELCLAGGFADGD